MVWEESRLVKDRLDSAMAAKAVLMQMVMSTVPNEMIKPSSTKTAKARFTDMIKKLGDIED